jgi:hypothetical protein
MIYLKHDIPEVQCNGVKVLYKHVYFTAFTESALRYKPI